jgi:hypothetical protein
MVKNSERLLALARNIVESRKAQIAIWTEIDHYENTGALLVKDEKHLEPADADITMGMAVRICLTYPSWLTKNKRKLSTMKDSVKKTELKQRVAKRETTLNYLKSLKE